MNFTPRRSVNLRLYAVIITFFLAASAAIAYTGCGGEEDDDGGETLEQSTRSVASSEKVATDEYTRQLAARRIGDPALVRTAMVTNDGGGKFVKVEVNRPYTCHDGAVVGEVALFTQQVMGILFQDPAVKQIDITMFGSTLAPEDKDKVAMTVMVTRETADTIDWFTFDHTNMLKLVSSFYLDPIIEQSYINEGGDPGLYQQTGGENGTTG